MKNDELLCFQTERFYATVGLRFVFFCTFCANRPLPEGIKDKPITRS